jgi:Carboxypeptidase regulatory-like domain/TonB-dependent Receptor Plug Domain
MRRISTDLRQVRKSFSVCMAFFIWGIFLIGRVASAQVDQGTITGVVQDASNAVIPGVQVKLTGTDTGLVLQNQTNGSGIYVFTPVKIGNYKISATSPGFETTTRENLHLDLEQRLNVVLVLKPGAVTETVTVTDEIPLLQTQEGSVGQVINTESLNDTPLNGRNWVYIAQLTAGVTPPFGGTRGSGTGDFLANGLSAEQNNFVLDGVDNNSNIPDFMNGASYLQRPPPDALAEFKIQTSNYNAEFGHSAGAVVNASIKSGTNRIHGDLWEYVRNTDLDATNWNALTNPPYHENQFGATLGFPILKEKLFYFGDVEANRISSAQTNTLTVPTPLMRTGNFSELLNTSLTGQAHPINLYIPNSGGNMDTTGQSTVNRQSCNSVANVLCTNQIDTAAQKILNLYPAEAGPNVGLTYNNLVVNVPSHNDTWQWDQRMDWNISQKDQVYTRYSYNHQQGHTAPPLGPVLDGSGYGSFENDFLAENGMFSETHIFRPTFVNEFRFGYNWGDFKFVQPNANTDIATQLGLGGLPYTPGYGGLPSVSVSGITGWGTNGFEPMAKTQNVYQILDNVTKILGNHSLKFGVALENLRFGATLGGTKHGAYSYTGLYTSSPKSSIATGSGVADFLVNQMHNTSITNTDNVDDQQSYNSAYVQDDWRATTRLTLNLGVRYDYYQPFKEMPGLQANFVVTGPLGIGTGSAVYQIPSQAQNVPIAAAFTQLLAANNVAIEYVNNNRLLTSQDTDFAPRVAFAYRADPKTVINGGFGIFYGGLQNEGGGNLGVNYPFTLSASIPAPSCSAGNCPSIGLTLENGLSAQLANGLQNFISSPSFHSTDPHIKEPYTEDYNLSVQQALSNSLVATVGYVGNVSRHIELYGAPNTAPLLLAAGKSTTSSNPFPGLGGVGQISYSGVGTYNALQAKMEKRYSNGLSFLGTYTWAHALDDSSDAGGIQTAIGYRQEAIIPVIDELTNSAYDVRHRITFNGNYQLPFGRGRAYLNDSRLADLAVGGWSTSLTFVAQTGIPFTVTPNNSGPAGGTARAIPVRNPFSPGGTPDPSNPTITCAPSTRNKTNWYNPCAFANPPAGTSITTPVTDIATAISFLGGRSNTIYGPGYNRVNMSLFKNFITVREQYLQFRADAFNLFNHPSLNNPSLTGLNSTGGGITAPKSLQANTPDARFFQLALKYSF